MEDIGRPNRNDVVAASEKSTHSASQCASAFAVDDFDLKDARGPARLEVSVEESRHIAGVEGVEVQPAVQRKRHRSVHLRLITPLAHRLDSRREARKRANASALGISVSTSMCSSTV